jgi:hypothetical protein
VWVFRGVNSGTLHGKGVDFGCWSPDHRFGSAKAIAAAEEFRPRDIAMQGRNGGKPVGATCGLIDTIYIPGLLAADAARILQVRACMH